MNQSINTDSKNSKEPQQKYHLGTVSIKILGGLNQFYGHPTSPSGWLLITKFHQRETFCYIDYNNWTDNSQIKIKYNSQIWYQCIYLHMKGSNNFHNIMPTVKIANLFWSSRQRSWISFNYCCILFRIIANLKWSVSYQDFLKYKIATNKESRPAIVEVSKTAKKYRYTCKNILFVMVAQMF